MNFLIHKKDGTFQNIKGWRDYVESLPDGKYLVSIEGVKKRSNAQNSFYHAVVVPLVYEALKDAGFDTVRTKEDAHLIMRSLFLKVIEQHGDIKIEKIMSTTELTTVGFMEYLNNISVWAADYLQLTIPEPNQQLLMNYD